MSIAEPDKIITPWASTGSKNPIPANANNATGAAGFDKGFPDITMTPEEAGGIPPAGQDFNGILYEVTSVLRYMQAGGLPHFSDNLSSSIGGYPIGSLVLGGNGVTIWQNQIDGNANDPDISTAGWLAVDVDLKGVMSRTTVNGALSNPLPVGSYRFLSDAGSALCVVVPSSDVGGYYYGTDSAGNKLRLIPLNNVVSAENLQMVPGTGQDNSAKLSALNGFDWSEFVVNGYYEYTSDVTILKPGKEITVRGAGRLHGVNAFLTIAGSITSFGVITAASPKYGRTITVANASGLSVGDTVCIHNQNSYSFSAQRPEYTAGEFNEVVKKVGNTLTLKNPLLFDYTSLLNIKLFKVNQVHLRHEQLDFSMSGSAAYALRVQFGEVVAAGKPNIKATGSTACAAALVYDKCPSVKYDLGDVYNDTVGSSTQYGVSFSSCWDAIGYVRSAFGYRHGVTTGGDAADCSIPCNRVLVLDSVVGNDPASLIYAADFHGNTMNSYYRSCTIYGDIGLAGENVGCPDSTIYAQRANVPIDFHEIVGGEIDLNGVKVVLTPSFAFDALVGFSASSLAQKVDRDFSITCKGANFGVNAGVGRIFNIIFNQTNAVESEFDISDLSMTGDGSGIVQVARLTQASPGKRPRRFSMKNVMYYLSDAQKFVTYSGDFTGCRMSLPGSTSKEVMLTIPAGGNVSTSGGVAGGYLNHTFPAYPIKPAASVNITGWVKSGDPKFFAIPESVSLNGVLAYLATADDAITTSVARTIGVQSSVTFDNVIL